MASLSTASRVADLYDPRLAYVMSGWGVLDPHARYLHSRSQGS